MNGADIRTRLRAALQLARDGEVRRALGTLHQLHTEQPASAEVAIALCRTALQHHDGNAAERALLRALALQPGHEGLAVELAVLCVSRGDARRGIGVLRDHVHTHPQSPLAWLLLGQLLDDTARQPQALQARLQAIARAHAAGFWRKPDTTPPHVAEQVRRAITALLAHRREVFMGTLELLRQSHGPTELARIDRALSGYLRECDATPPDPMQRPRVFYVPDLPSLPYLDPTLQPWAARLSAAFTDIRNEALAVAQESCTLEDFVEVKEGDRIGNYLGGLQPSWEAFFFYRHGQRYDDNHLRCPRTSALLESIDLARIPGQTPEVCFSVLAPDTHILPHHGVTNARAVMHLPLVVPPHCALNLVDRGTHQWREGELVMFDDTFLHEAWNRSSQTRIILLMDCWNPYVTAAEREAVVRLSEAIGLLDVALPSSAWTAAQ